MREVALESRACGACGAGPPDEGAGGYVFVEGRGGAFLSVPGGGGVRGVPRERSGLAYAAGYAGVLYLFRFAFAPLALSGWWPAWALGTTLLFLLALLAPLALALAFAAGVSLDRSPERSGRLPALFGLLVGLCGSYTFLFLGDSYIWRWLAAF